MLTREGQNVKHSIDGTYECSSQYHFSMETQVCVCIPSEDGMDVYAATQWMDLVQTSIATVLNVPVNRYKQLYYLKIKACHLFHA